MNEKITAEEVQLLRTNAEKERKIHAQVLELIATCQKPLTEAQELEILARKRESEVLKLLEVYAKEYASHRFGFVLSVPAQLFIYDSNNNLPKSKDYMLHKTELCSAVEKKIFDDDLQIIINEEGKLDNYPKFTSEGETYMVEQTLKKAVQSENADESVLIFLHEYTQTHNLSSDADTALMEFLFVQADCKKPKKYLCRFVLDYLARYGILSASAQIRLIQSGNHDLIMYYITRSKKVISNQKVIDELISRGDREEVKAYFKRYEEED